MLNEFGKSEMSLFESVLEPSSLIIYRYIHQNHDNLYELLKIFIVLLHLIR